MKTSKIRKITLYGLFIALVAISTMIITIPMIGTQGYVNVGDTMIFITAILLGPKAGLIAGGVGSALADLLLGFAFWAPWTLVIKGIEGFIAGMLGQTSFARYKKITPRIILAMIAAALWMVAGYFVAGGFMVGFEAALGSVPGNLIQGGVSVIIALPLAYVMGKIYPKLTI